MSNTSLVVPQENSEIVLWDGVMDWVSNAEDLNPLVKDELLRRLADFKLKVNTIVVELQRRQLEEVALDVQFESDIRREIRKNFIYMTPTERAQTLKTLKATNEETLMRLERQMAGFDLFANTEQAIQTLSDTKLPENIVETVQAMAPARRRNLLTVINQIKAAAEKEEAANDGKEADSNA